MTGRELLEDILRHTGLPKDLISKELNFLIKKAGLEDKEISLEDVRQIMNDYLQDVLVNAKKHFSAQ